MTNTTEMRALSPEEIDAVAGGSSINVINVLQGNTATATATSTGSVPTVQPWHPHGQWHW